MCILASYLNILIGDRQIYFTVIFQAHPVLLALQVDLVRLARVDLLDSQDLQDHQWEEYQVC